MVKFDLGWLYMQNDISRLTILYVEDDEIIRQNIIEYLGHICAKVLGAKDGLEALEVYKNQKPDIIISDIQTWDLQFKQTIS